MARYAGKSGRIYVGASAGGAAVAVIAQSKWSLNLARDRFEVTAFGDSNKQYVQGLPDVSFTFSGFYDDTEDTIFSAADAAAGVNVYLYPDAANAPTKYWYGTAYIDITEVGVDAAGANTIAGSGQAAGTWARK